MYFFYSFAHFLSFLSSFTARRSPFTLNMPNDSPPLQLLISTAPKTTMEAKRDRDRDSRPPLPVQSSSRISLLVLSESATVDLPPWQVRGVGGSLGGTHPLVLHVILLWLRTGGSMKACCCISVYLQPHLCTYLLTFIHSPPFTYSSREPQRHGWTFSLNGTILYSSSCYFCFRFCFSKPHGLVPTSLSRLQLAREGYW